MEISDGELISEWLVLNDETVPMGGIPRCLSIHPEDVPELIKKLQGWNKPSTPIQVHTPKKHYQQ